VETSEPIIFVVDDDLAMREALSALLRSLGLRVQTFGSAHEFLGHPRPDAPACLVLDVRLPALSGVDLQLQLGRNEDEIPIIFITGHGDVPMSVRAMKAGAVEFLLKPFSDHDLLNAIRVALGRDTKGRELRALLGEMRRRYGTLTPRERQVMSLVIRGMLNKQIAAQLGVSEITVKVHRRQIMRKMEAQSLAQLVRMGERLG
jgi:FixJ family two-component response regulator